MVPRYFLSPDVADTTMLVLESVNSLMSKELRVHGCLEEPLLTQSQSAILIFGGKDEASDVQYKHQSSINRPFFEAQTDAFALAHFRVCCSCTRTSGPFCHLQHNNNICPMV